MNEYNYWLRLENLQPIKFYPYTSRVINRVLTQNHNYKTEEADFLEDLGNKLKTVIVSQGIYWDNKVVIECKLTNTAQKSTCGNIFIGKYDNLWSVGFGVMSDDWINPIELK